MNHPSTQFFFDKNPWRKIVVSLRALFSFRYLKLYIVAALLICLFLFLSQKGLTEVGIHADLARDLNEMSNLWLWRVVWLGPQLSAGFPISPLYFYLHFPGLLISAGSANSLIFSHVFFAISAIAFWVWSVRKKSLLTVVLTVFPITLFPWWLESSTEVWNGHMYVSFILITCVSLWHSKSFLISSFAFGIALALHPASILLAPIIGYEFFTQKKKAQNILFLLSGILLPWVPIFAFEWITKGLLTRNWFEHHESTLTFFVYSQNYDSLFGHIGVPKWISFFTWVGVYFWTDKKGKAWWLLLTTTVLLLLFIRGIHEYYLLGLVCGMTFLAIQTLASKKLGKVVLLALLCIFGFKVLSTPFVPSSRSIQYLNQIVETSISEFQLSTEYRYAIVNLRDELNSTPQADDYRFFLRTKGFDVVNTTEHQTADRLLLFIEVAEFNGKNWNDSWHVNQFGEKEFVQEKIIEGIQVVEYKRKE